MEDRRWINTAGSTVLTLAQIEMSLIAIGNDLWLACSSSGDPFMLLSSLLPLHSCPCPHALTLTPSPSYPHTHALALMPLPYCMDAAVHHCLVVRVNKRKELRNRAPHVYMRGHIPTTHSLTYHTLTYIPHTHTSPAHPRMRSHTPTTHAPIYSCTPTMRSHITNARTHLPHAYSHSHLYTLTHDSRTCHILKHPSHTDHAHTYEETHLTYHTRAHLPRT